MGDTIKNIDEYFRDWEAETMGFGYGTGEEHTLSALKGFMDSIEDGRKYDYTKVEAAIGAASCWFLINILCRHNVDILEYGTSPRFGWLTEKGKRLKQYIDTKTVGELVNIVCDFDYNEYTNCYRTACNCGEGGYEEGRVCQNPFFI